MATLVEATCHAKTAALLLLVLLVGCAGVVAQSQSTAGKGVVSAAADNPPESRQPVEDGDGFMRNLSQVEFEEELEDRYTSVYRRYKKLPEQSRIDVYASYWSGASAEALRSMVMKRFSQDRLQTK